MSESEELLKGMSTIYEWLLECNDHLVDGGFKHQTLREACEGWQRDWETLLPAERRELVDHLLAAFAQCLVNREEWNVLQATQGTLWSAVRAALVHAAPNDESRNLTYDDLCTELKLTPPFWELPTDDIQNAAVTHVAALVQELKETYSSLGHPRHEAERWAHDLFTKQGITKDKLMRLHPSGDLALIHALQAVQEALRALPPGGAHRPKMPNALELFERAEFDSQSGTYRGEAYHRLLGTLAVLYSRSNTTNMAARPAKEEQADLALAAVTAFAHGDENRFLRLDTVEQQRVVAHARKVVYATCREFHHDCQVAVGSVRARRGAGQAGMSLPPVGPLPVLPDVRTLLDDIRRPLLHRDLSAARVHGHAASPGSSHDAFMVDSLAHSSSAPRFSPYYARKYYSSSALARQAGLA